MVCALFDGMLCCFERHFGAHIEPVFHFACGMYPFDFVLYDIPVDVFFFCLAALPFAEVCAWRQLVADAFVFLNLGFESLPFVSRSVVPVSSWNTSEALELNARDGQLATSELRSDL